jgi:hypothetical protein
MGITMNTHVVAKNGDAMIIHFHLQVNQSVVSKTNIFNINATYDKCDPKICDFLQVLWFPPPIKLEATI